MPKHYIILMTVCQQKFLKIGTIIFRRRAHILKKREKTAARILLPP